MNVNHFKLLRIGIALMLAGVTASLWAQSDAGMSLPNEHAMNMADGMKCGAAHHEMMKKTDLTISKQSYAVPAVMLSDSTGKQVALQSLLDGDQPVAVNFIFTTCTTICPIMTATFAQMRRELGAEADRIQLVSITIDPEHDTPAVLSEYAKRFNATPTWHFLTGKPKDIEQVLRTFDAWTGTKTNHRPITLMRSKGDSKWVRLEGLASGTALAKQVQLVLH
jgi:protein SCO1/2